MLKTYVSNRQELLLDRLVQVLEAPSPSVLCPEVILVQSKGMERWISLELAARWGICANCRFLFPNTLVEEVFEAYFSGSSQDDGFSKDRLAWRIMGLLPTLSKERAFEDIRRYLSEDPTGLKLYQVSAKVADLFDQYLTFRPDMLLKWERTRDSSWQAVLWRKIVGDSTGTHRAALLERFLECAARGETPGSHLPVRISVFGISYLPGFHLEVLNAISRFSDVHFFLMNPCKVYWGDIRSSREIAGIEAAAGRKEQSEPELHFEEGALLLASLGVHGREFFNLVQDMDVTEESQDFEDPGTDTLLAKTQSEILNLGDGEVQEPSSVPLSPPDHSIAIHSCHSPMREIEVLHDALLSLFQSNPELRPEDVAVMTPDIDIYAPFIRAVFDAPEEVDERIPYTVADRSLRNEGRLAEPFLALLALWEGRLGVSEVQAIAEALPVRQRFGFSETDMELLARWVSETGIRWGLDGEERARLGLPRTEENTWRAGLDRLLLGLAMPDGQGCEFAGIIPYDAIEGASASILGAFLEFAERLFRWRAQSGEAKTLEEWGRLLLEVLDAFFEPSAETEREMQTIRGMIQRLSSQQADLGEGHKVGPTVVSAFFKQRFQGEYLGSGFLGGGVTFCSMLPMRSIPFEVICLLGMDSEAFPRKSKVMEFDLIARHPRPGDRSRRHDDRYLFLETLLSARRKLHISYVGQRIQDNEEISPSVVVSELLDSLQRTIGEAHEATVERLIVTKHRLQAFNPAYFREEGNLFSYSKVNCRAAQSLNSIHELPPFFGVPLDEPGEEWRTVDLDFLCDFFSNPCKVLLKNRLGAALEEEVPSPEDREVFALDALQAHKVREEMSRALLAGEAEQDVLRRMVKLGRLPHGVVGLCGFDRLKWEVKAFVERVRESMTEERPPMEVDMTFNHFRLVGGIRGIRGQGLVGFRCAKIKPKDRLRMWIRHLVLCALSVEPPYSESLHIGLDLTCGYARPQDPRAVLASLLELYGEGLRRPIPFYPVASFTYAAERLKDKSSEAKALRKALREWVSGDFPGQQGEDRDPYFDACFRDKIPLGDEFRSLAERIFFPMLEHERELKA